MTSTHDLAAQERSPRTSFPHRKARAVQRDFISNPHSSSLPPPLLACHLGVGTIVAFLLNGRHQVDGRLVLELELSAGRSDGARALAVALLEDASG